LLHTAAALQLLLLLLQLLHAMRGGLRQLPHPPCPSRHPMMWTTLQLLLLLLLHPPCPAPPNCPPQLVSQ
jgi:hypothetical protein